MYGWHTRRVAPADLIAFAWSAPMRDLAARVGMSDVGLKKLLRSYGVSAPPQGHWNRVHAGRAVPAPPAASARGPGQRPYLHVDSRFADLPEVDLPSSAGPFATSRVPEDLEELRARELKAIGRAVSAAKISMPHPAIQMLLNQDEKERARAAANRWHTPVILYESPFEKRRLRILNAVFLTLTKMGHHAASDRDENLTTFAVIIGNTHVSLTLDEATRKAVAYNRYTAPRPDPKRSATAPLRLTAGSSTWQDSDTEKLEGRIAEITAGLIVEGERAYRMHLRELEERAERQRVEADRQRQERLRKANAERAAALLESGRLLAEAENLRSLIARVGAAVADGRLDLSADQLSEWRRWADREADKLDPVMSGQVKAHLLPPGEVR